MADKKLGIWLVGACGNVATTATLGLFALQKGMTTNAGLVTELPPFAKLGLASWQSMVVGGHDIRSPCMTATAERLAAEGVVPRDLLDACREDLAEVESRIQPGIAYRCGKTIRALADMPLAPDDVSPRTFLSQIQSDLQAFRDREGVDQVVVVYLASTEPLTGGELPTTWTELEPLLEETGETSLRASSLYAITALERGLPFVNFTPSAGASLPAIDDLARRRGVCHAGQDGKTGETLLKTVLAPMFAHRNLEVMSWVGHNIFGNLDGSVLNDPENRAAKIQTKDKVLGGTLGYDPQTLVSIEYIKSLGDWKTAWDHVHFRGFLGTPMTLQCTWQGSDSALAAPLVLDLVRLLERSSRAGESGPLAHLASFFKSPLGSDEHDFAEQYRRLLEWAERHSAAD